MLLRRLVDCSRSVAETRSRKQKRAHLAGCIAELERPHEVAVGVPFLAGLIRQGRIGLGYQTVFRCQPPSAATPSLTLAEVDAALERIAGARGAGSSDVKKRELGRLLERADAHEQAFLKRLLVGELRQGALEGVLLDALAEAASVAPASVRRAHMLTGDLAAVAQAALTGGEAALGRFALELFRPVRPMLAQTADDPAAAVVQLGEAALEHKVDGARVQVHKRGGDVAVYTRGLKDVTERVPEIVAGAAALGAGELVLDGEVVALRPDETPHPFQTTMRRFGRKLDVARMREELPLTAMFFDCLHADGETLLDRPARERFEAMSVLLPAAAIIERRVGADADEAEAFLESALAAGHEGIMAKSLNSAYQAGNRGADWLKIKPAHTLDLVVLAAEWGSGRRRGWLSNLHLGARNPDGSFTMLGKTFKGMTDQMLRWQTAELERIAIARDEHTVFVEPKLVVEVAFNDVQTSPHYPGGLALRFARVKRYRPDKSPEEADTIETVRAIHARAHC